MKRVTFEATTGSETIEWGLAKVAMFVHDRGEEEFVSKSPVARRIGPLQFQPAVPGIPEDISGRWVTASYEVPEGTIMKVYARVKVSRWGAVSSTGSIILRAREDAPMIRVTIPLSGHDSTALKEARITGRFDLLTLKVAQGRYGFKPMERDAATLYSQSSVNAVCQIKELAEGKKVAERVREIVVAPKEGETAAKPKVVVSVRKMRKLGI